MGELEKLYAIADISIMGRIFCTDGLKPDDDHSPLEATINSHAVAGINNKIPKAYHWLYENSGLVHQCSTFDQVLESVNKLISDPYTVDKLYHRMEWIKENRKKYLQPLKELILQAT